jgi:hypothetical protein
MKGFKENLMRRKRLERAAGLLPALALCVVFGAGFDSCGGAPDTPRGQIVHNNARLTDAVTAASKVNEKLYEANKISEATALDRAERLKLVTAHQREMQKKVSPWVREVEAQRRAAKQNGDSWVEPPVPDHVRNAVVSGAVAIGEALRGAGGSDELGRAVSDILDIASDLRAVFGKSSAPPQQ